jgi:murein L,D-transpeptidase YcbB/YkuD
VYIVKSIFFILITIFLAVALEAMTFNSVKEVNAINSSFKELSANHKNYGKDVTLSEIIYSEKTTKGLMDLLINKEASTLKPIRHKKFIKEIYKKSRYTPLWFTNKGVKSKKVTDLFEVIEADVILSSKGNIVKKYKHLKESLASKKSKTLQEELSLELQLSDLYRSYLGFHIYGSIQWGDFQNKLRRLRRNKISADWLTYDPKYNIAELMFSNHTLPEIITATTPNSFGYKKMLKELKRLRKVQKNGGWKKIPSSSQLRAGRSGAMVKRLTLRLQSEGDYTCKHSGLKYTYDNCLKKAVKRFQKRHGIARTGTITKYTRSKLNLSVNWKINKILLNLDRIKRLPDQPENRYILVNIPDFRLYYRENGRQKLTMRVVVGDKKHHTPIFSNKISFIVLNPYWMIPDSIVKKEMIPNILKNPDYLEQRGYEVRRSYNLNRPTIDTKSINWARVLRNGQTKRYKFMQPPGPKNALGKIKFKFPNQFAVYLHDTPAKKYFKKARRAFSHGCIRIAQPNALLATFAPHERSVNYNRAQRILRGKRKTQLNLSKRVPVHIVYLTAWIKSDGLLHYISDVYNYDTKQRRTIY